MQCYSMNLSTISTNAKSLHPKAWFTVKREGNAAVSHLDLQAALRWIRRFEGVQPPRHSTKTLSCFFTNCGACPSSVAVLSITSRRQMMWILFAIVQTRICSGSARPSRRILSHKRWRSAFRHSSMGWNSPNSAGSGAFRSRHVSFMARNRSISVIMLRTQNPCVVATAS